jgi:hypothetical protein
LRALLLRAVERFVEGLRAVVRRFVPVLLRAVVRGLRAVLLRAVPLRVERLCDAARLETFRFTFRRVRPALVRLLLLVRFTGIACFSVAWAVFG